MAAYRLKTVYDWPIALRGVVFAIVFAATLYGGYWLDLSHFFDSLSQQKQKELDLKQQLESTMHKSAVAENELAQLPILKKQLANLQKNVIHYAELPNLLKDILKIGTTHHLYFTLFDPGDENKKQLYATIPIKVVAVGTYHQISQFISGIANMPWIVTIGPFAISKEKLVTETAIANSGTVTAELLLNVYYFPKS